MIRISLYVIRIPFSRMFVVWKIALAIRITPSVIWICFPEVKTSLSDSNNFFEDSNPLYREPEVLKFNISDSNHSFEYSNPLTILGIKPFSFFKWTILFQKQISRLFQISHKPNQIVFFNWFFFKTHTHTHLISSFFIISFPKNPKSVMDPSQPKEPKMKSTVARSLKEMDKGQCHNGFPFDLKDHKNKWSRHRSFLYGCDRSLEMHVLKLATEIHNLNTS